MNKYSLKFKSNQLERSYNKHQIGFILDMHKKTSILIVLICIVIIIVTLSIQKYISAGFMMTCLLATVAQLVYFRLKPSIQCIHILNVFNISFALFHVVQAYYKCKGCEADIGFYNAVAYISIHYTLLLNPLFTTNVAVILVISSIHVISSFIANGSFLLDTLSIFPVVVVFLYKNYNEIKQQRQTYQLQLKEDKWSNIIITIIQSLVQVFRKVYNQPYMTVKFNQNDIKFELIEANSFAQEQFNIQESNSMRKWLRNLKVPRQENIDLELHLFRLIQSPVEFENNQVECQEYDDNMEVKNQNIVVKMFCIDAIERAYLLIVDSQAMKDQFMKMKDYIANKYRSSMYLLQQQQAARKKILKILRQKSKPLKKDLIESVVNLALFKGLNMLEIIPYRYTQNLKSKLIKLSIVLAEIRQLFRQYKNIRFGILDTPIQINTYNLMLKLVLINQLLNIIKSNKNQLILVVLEVKQWSQAFKGEIVIDLIIRVKSLGGQQLSAFDNETQSKQQQIRNQVTNQLLLHISTDGNLIILRSSDKSNLSYFNQYFVENYEIQFNILNLQNNDKK